MKRNNFRRVLDYVFRQRMIIVLFVFASVGASLFQSLPLLLVKMFLDSVIQHGDLTMLAKLAGLLMVCWVFQGYFTARREVATQYLARRSTTDLVNDVGASLLRRPLSYFSEMRSGDLISRIMTDAQASGQAVNLWLQLMREPLTVVLVVGTIVYLNWKLALIGFLGFPLAVYPLMVLGRRITKASRKARELTAELADSMVQLFSGMKVVKAYQLEEVATRDFTNTTNGMFYQNMKQERAAALSHPLVALINGTGVAVVIVIGGTMVISGSLAPSDLLTFILSFIAIHKPVSTIGGAYNQLKYMTPGLDRMFEILDHQAGTSIAARGTVEPKPLSKAVSFENVTFTYGRETVLKEFNTEIEAGKVTALVGQTGGGKTTALDLVAGFYSPTEGRILWDGIDLRELEPVKFLNRISYAPQQPVLFNVSLRENVLLGRPGTGNDEVESVCKLAGIHDDIMHFKQGYDTPAGEAGGGLSGGQKQRIGLARALLRKDASLFIFDEPTSSLDLETEVRLWKDVRTYLSGKTVLLVAHRLTLVRNADRIVTVVNGKVEASGTHDEILKSSPTYSNLWRLHGEG